MLLCFRIEELFANLETRFFLNNYLAVSWPNFSQFGSQIADLQYKMCAQLGPIFILRKQGKHNFVAPCL